MTCLAETCNIFLTVAQMIVLNIVSNIFNFKKEKNLTVQSLLLALKIKYTLTGTCWFEQINFVFQNEKFFIQLWTKPVVHQIGAI